MRACKYNKNYQVSISHHFENCQFKQGSRSTSHNAALMINIRPRVLTLLSDGEQFAQIYVIQTGTFDLNSFIIHNRWRCLKVHNKL